MAAEMLPRGDEPEYVPPPKQQSLLNAALAKAQGAFAQIHRDKTVTVTMKSGGKYSFSYAPLETILAAVMPALSSNGLSLTQLCVMLADKEYLRTELRHASGEMIANNTRILIGDAGPQAYGSALTYARRYGVTLLLCISADDDDDGNAAEGNESQATSKGSHEPMKLDGPALTPQKREAYLPEITRFITAEDDMGLRQLWDELQPNEQAGIWSLLNSKQKAKARELLQKVAA